MNLLPTHYTTVVQGSLASQGTHRKIHMNQSMSRPAPCGAVRRGSLVCAAALAALLASNSALAGPPGFEIENAEPGGLNPQMQVTSFTVVSNTVTLKWAGFGGPYQVLKAVGLPAQTWQALGAPTEHFTMITNRAAVAPMAILQVTGPDPVYVGAARCGDCHPDAHESWMTTVHEGALDTLKAIHVDKNPTCLKCHTVGYGLPNGFKDESTTPHLAGVQCENCHGPGGAHVKKPTDKLRQPVISLTAKICGGCHQDVHHPTYEEWETTLHAEVTEGGLGMSNPDGSAVISRMNTCGACHSGAVRQAFVKAAEEAAEVEPGDPPPPVEYPTGTEAAHTGITCAVCHEPHSAELPAQLRYPMASLTPYSYNTGTNFTSQYKPEINVCGQCHNMRGAAWTSSGRPPHHSPQYNILIGNGGYQGTNNTPPQSSHMQIDTQCAHCHVDRIPVPAPTEENPNYEGHTFRPKVEACMPCHDAEGAMAITEGVQASTKRLMNGIITDLNLWATTKAPAALQKYGTLAWEYTSVGQLSATTPPTPGPTATEQALIPNGIKQARFNLYLIEHDASYGVHNGNYSRFLLKVSKDLVQAELKK